MKKKLPFLIGSFFSLALYTGCYYDKEELLYPETPCDTVNVSYSHTIKPILENRCYSCHSTSPVGNIGLDDHAEVVMVANNGRLMGSIRHLSPYRAMPDGGGKLTECQISVIQAWINQGTKNN